VGDTAAANTWRSFGISTVVIELSAQQRILL
jgi:hypothetical protein